MQQAAAATRAAHHVGGFVAKKNAVRGNNNKAAAQRRAPVVSRRGSVRVEAGIESASVTTSTPQRESRKDGRPVYSPDSYQDICYHVYQSTLDGINDGLRLMEVEFPAVPGEDASYKAASDVYIDLNIQYALTVFSKIYKETGKTCEILVPDGPEYRRAKKVFANSLELSDGCTLNTLDEKKTEAVGSFFGNMMGGKGLRTRSDEEGAFGGFNADVYCVVNLSCIELPSAERFVNEKAEGKPVVFLNCELDTLRADLGLFSFPEKTMHYRFLSKVKPVYYLRTRAYSRTINVSPFVVNYSGAVFREYPAPWQVMVKQNTGELVCVAEDEDRFTLGEAKEEMLIALGLSDEDGSTMKFLRAGYKTATWWEEENDEEESDAWRT